MYIKWKWNEFIFKIIMKWSWTISWSIHIWAQTGSVSRSCVDGWTNQRLRVGTSEVEGWDEVFSDHAGSGGGMRRVKCGGCWCDHLTRVGGTRWWWQGDEVLGSGFEGVAVGLGWLAGSSGQGGGYKIVGGECSMIYNHFTLCCSMWATSLT